MSKFVKGTIILLAASLITRVLGFINRIVIARFIGEEGVGLYMMVLPTLFLVVAITQMGLPVAISKFVAEADAKGDVKKIKKILVVSLSCTIILSLIFTPALIVLAPILSETLFTDSRTVWPLMAIAPIIPIVAVSSVLRGYFQGRQNMKPSAISQIIEQGVRITLIAVMTGTFLPYGIEYAAAAAMAASVIGELASLIYLLTTFKLKKHFRMRKGFVSGVKAGRGTLKELMSVALPTTGNRMIGNVAWFFEPIVISQGLLIAGVSATMITKQYGELTGYAIPLLLIPSFVTFSLSTSLIPAISEANSTGNFKLMEFRLQQSLKITFITGCFAVVTLYVFAEPIMQVLYGSSHAAVFIKVLAPFFLFYYYQFPLQSVLQALNKANAAMINSLVGNVIKLFFMFVLCSKPSFGIMGAALGTAIGIVLVTFLHFFSIMKILPFTLHIRHYLYTLLCAGSAAWIGKLLFTKMAEMQSELISVLLAILSMGFCFFFLLTFIGIVRREELRRIPYIGRFLSMLALR
ncbi:stage V sporulation protein B [Bacillus sp. M6-12]|uniref:stage V sporulation protein B n=1 Tax=Bacillus sp. M6-12 TaxID=2054166 RepID=UPI000C76F873|nr:stage V sporulation protein B [Bacillus sp. M6-12]PLS15628.1 stage V sporulation protein B [Bacillus sp. M6-12]